MIDAAVLARFTGRLSYDFVDAALFERAITHRSWCAEHAGYDSNERLEFLGDAILGALVAEFAYANFPEASEGWLTRARASVVRASALADMATELGVGEIVRLGKGETQTGGREKTSILSDTLEAVIGAVYLDGGIEAARSLVVRLVAPRLADLPVGDGDQDDKSRLQELAARLALPAPAYTAVGEGPDHEAVFRATVSIGGTVMGEGVGRSKKQAEAIAARAAHDGLLSADGGDPVPVGAGKQDEIRPGDENREPHG